MKSLSRRRFLRNGSSAAVAAQIAPIARATAGRPKNVLFIGCDDQNTRLGCYGDSFARTPHLDALAGRGMRFGSAYCQYPLCGPSRQSLMTGLSPDTIGVHDLDTFFRTKLPNAVTISQLFARNGYWTGRVGKIFHQDVPVDIGTSGQDDPLSWQYVFNPLGKDRTQEEPGVTNFTPQKVKHRTDGKGDGIGSSICFEKSALPDSAMTDSLGADEIIRLLGEHRHKPFFLAYGLYRPHVPWIVPSEYFDRFPLDSIVPVPRPEGNRRLAPAAAYTTDPDNFGMSTLQQRQALQAYYASSAFMDAQVGRVLAELRRLGLENDTLVVYWADHGFSLGEHGQWQKLNIFESATHVPLIVAGPGVSRGVCAHTVEHLDIYPTLAEFCGLHGTPLGLEGTSLAPLLRKPASEWDKPAVSQVNRKGDTVGYSLRNADFRYTAWSGDSAGEELYDYRSDPFESQNLASHGEQLERKQQLRARLKSILAQRGAKALLG
jgi:iduronate 2-sulfatase